ncbi:hypothetical protein ACVWWN_000168 [Mycobacterium sp. URHB0021]
MTATIPRCRSRSRCSAGVGLIAADAGRARAWPATAVMVDFQVRKQMLQHGAVVGLAGAHEHYQRSSSSVDEVMNLAGQPAAGAANAMVRRRAGQIRVIRPSPGAAGDVRGVLVSTGNRGIHRHRSVDGPGFVGSGQQPSQHDIAGAFGAHPSVPGPDRLPRSEHLGHLSPGDPTPVPVNNPLDDLASISKGLPFLPVRAGRSSSINDHWASVSNCKGDIP